MILHILAKRLGKENISEIEGKAITEDMNTVADKIAEADRQDKKSHEKMRTKVLWILGIGFMVIGAGVGIHSALGSEELLMQTEHDEMT